MKNAFSLILVLLALGCSQPDVVMEEPIPLNITRVLSLPEEILVKEYTLVVELQYDGLINRMESPPNTSKHYEFGEAFIDGNVVHIPPKKIAINIREPLYKLGDDFFREYKIHSGNIEYISLANESIVITPILEGVQIEKVYPRNVEYSFKVDETSILKTRQYLVNRYEVAEYNKSTLSIMRGESERYYRFVHNGEYWIFPLKESFIPEEFIWRRDG